MPAGMFQPIVNPVDPRTYTKQGIEDRSAAMAAQGGMADVIRTKGNTDLISEVGKMAMDAWKGYEVTQVANKQIESMEAFVKGDVSHFRPDAAEEIKESIGAVQDATINLAEEWKGKGTPWIGASSPETNLAAANQRLASALKQGRITSDEFDARVRSNLREAINRTPGFQAELVAQTQKIMDLSGISDFKKFKDKQESAEQKAREMQMDVYKSYVIKAEVDPAKFGGNLEIAGQYAAQILQERARVQDGLNNLKVLVETGKLQRDQVDQVIASPDFNKSQSIAYQQLHQTIRNNFESGAYAANRPQGMSDIDANITGMQQEIEKQRSTFRGLLAKGSEASRPAINDYIKQLDHLETTYKEVMLGRFDAEKKKSVLDAVNAAAKLPFARGDAAIDHSNKIASFLEHMKNATGQFPKIDDTFVNGYYKFAEDQSRFMLGSGTTPFATIDVSTAAGQRTLNSQLAFIVPEKAVGMGPEDAIRVNSNNMLSAIKSLDTIANKTQYTAISDSIVSHINSTTYSTGKPISNIISIEAQQELAIHLEKSIGQVVNTGKLSYDPRINKLTVTDAAGREITTATKKANDLFKAVNSVRGRAKEESIDAYGADILRMSQETWTAVEKSNEANRVLPNPTPANYEDNSLMMSIPEKEPTTTTRGVSGKIGTNKTPKWWMQ